MSESRNCILGWVEVIVKVMLVMLMWLIVNLALGLNQGTVCMSKQWLANS